MPKTLSQQLSEIYAVPSKAAASKVAYGMSSGMYAQTGLSPELLRRYGASPITQARTRLRLASDSVVSLEQSILDLENLYNLAMKTTDKLGRMLPPQLKVAGTASSTVKADTKLRPALKSVADLDRELLRQRLGNGQVLSLARAMTKAIKYIKLAGEAIARLAQTNAENAANAELAREYYERLAKLVKQFKIKMQRAKKLLRNKQLLEPHDAEHKKLKATEQARKVYEQWLKITGTNPVKKEDVNLVKTLVMEQMSALAAKQNMDVGDRSAELKVDSELVADIVMAVNNMIQNSFAPLERAVPSDIKSMPSNLCRPNLPRAVLGVDRKRLRPV